MIQDGGGHGRGGGFAVAAGDGDAVFQTHQFGKQLAARDDGNLQAPGFLHFGILLIDRRTDDQSARAGYVGGIVPLEDVGAQGGQPVGDRRQLEIRAGNGIAKVEQNLGDTAHADSPYPREMQMLLAKKHLFTVLFRLAAPVSIEIVVFDPRRLL